jgi:flagellar motor switch protein FliM
MSRVLTQEEIDALLAATPADAGLRSERSAPVIAYNFRHPDRVSKDQIRSLHFLHDRFARNATASLSAFLRTTTELSIVSVEQFAYSEFLLALPDPTAFYAVALPPFDTLTALELNPGVAFAMIDRILGGSGESGAPQRALTEIEQNVVDGVVRLLLEHLTESWKTVTDLRFNIHARETRPQMLPVASWNEVVVVVTFDLKVGEARGLLNICLPASIIEASGNKLGQSWQHSHRDRTPVEGQWLTESLGLIPLNVTADIQTSLKTRDLVNLRPGHVLSLGVPSEVDINVRVGEIVKFKGRLATTAGRAAVLLNQKISTVAGGRQEQGR